MPFRGGDHKERIVLSRVGKADTVQGSQNPKHAGHRRSEYQQLIRMGIGLSPPLPNGSPPSMAQSPPVLVQPRKGENYESNPAFIPARTRLLFIH